MRSKRCANFANNTNRLRRYRSRIRARQARNECKQRHKQANFIRHTIRLWSNIITVPLRPHNKSVKFNARRPTASRPQQDAYQLCHQFHLLATNTPSTRRYFIPCVFVLGVMSVLGAGRCRLPARYGMRWQAQVSPPQEQYDLYECRQLHSKTAKQRHVYQCSC